MRPTGKANGKDAAGYLTLQFLAWLAEAPRSYGECMEAWRTSCPRLTIWEDAVRAGLVKTRNGRGAMRQSTVALTARGRRLLARGAAEREKEIRAG
jgi:hypothetical protein